MLDNGRLIGNRTSLQPLEWVLMEGFGRSLTQVSVVGQENVRTCSESVTSAALIFGRDYFTDQCK